MKYYKKKSNKFLYIVSVFIVLFIICPIFCTHSFTVSADSKQYTNVLEDLQKDSNFNVEIYPIVENDYSLKVIQIAESVNKELFVYVYQPNCENIQASSINISTGINDNIKYVNYQLILLNSSGTLFKYLVKDFELKQDALRYYDISNIYRYYIENIDTNLTNDNTISEVAYAVGELWTASTVNNEVSYTHTTTETINITNKYVGFLRYSNGFTLYASACDSHYVAFSTDKNIDNLIEADIFYLKRDAQYDNISGTKYEDTVESAKTLVYTDKVIKEEGGIGGYAHTWNRIESTSDFIKNEKLISSVKNEVSKMQWVLRFDETDYTTRVTKVHTFLHKTTWYTEVTDVTILRLKFVTDGTVYNLGVVDNKQSGDLTPDNEVKNPSWWDKLWSQISKVGKIILIIILGIALLPFLPYIIKLIINIILLPFKIFKK